MKRFEIITETDARVLEIGSTVELAAGGIVTPLARDTLAARRVTVVPVGVSDPHLPADLAPVADVRRVVIGSDHSGVALKRTLIQHLRGRALSVIDVGTDSADPVDYPDIAAAVGLAVARKEADAGIVIDGAGIGSAIAANRIRGVRAAMCRRGDRPILARAQRRQCPRPGRSAPAGHRGGNTDRQSMAGDGDARGSLHQAPDEDPPAGRTPVNQNDLQRLVRSSPRSCSQPRVRRPADALRLSCGAVGLLSDALAWRARRRRDSPGAACNRRRS